MSAVEFWLEAAEGGLHRVFRASLKPTAFLEVRTRPSGSFLLGCRVFLGFGFRVSS